LALLVSAVGTVFTAGKIRAGSIAVSISPEGDVLSARPYSAICRRSAADGKSERSYLTVLPTWNCALEVTDIVLGASAAYLATRWPQPPIGPMIASVSASAPAAGFRDFEVMCIRIRFLPF